MYVVGDLTLTLTAGYRYEVLTFCPFNIHSSPFLTALVVIPLTSEPHPGSVTPYACQYIDTSIINNNKQYE